MNAFFFETIDSKTSQSVGAEVNPNGVVSKRSLMDSPAEILFLEHRLSAVECQSKYLGEFLCIRAATCELPRRSCCATARSSTASHLFKVIMMNIYEFLL
jgi:hypothetical protein